MSAEREIQNLMARYCMMLDAGDFDGLAELLSDCTLNLDGATASGREEIPQLARAALKVYDDGTLRTSHITSNILLEVDESAETARARSYYTIFQGLENFPLQVIATGRWTDRFERRDGQWRFVEREARIHTAGDVSHYIQMQG
ncbi:nuclear transport factor 2 family protein [Micromonospora mirobrigensis]|uniref:SnoaL-like domain-containing protein n=1 Tax=Micromonospora mirobrigensis TaxID=262898 RepID=A0A1C4Z3Q9_9ACTN|nr:nuclear transport factor 2 family protein [Micromonospora mirobrigensis]SCF27546.1 SnoaL-like domain-containing protein [Micromonospora mirobrigensis]